MLSILTLLLLSSFTLATPLEESTDAAKEAINCYSLLLIFNMFDVPMWDWSDTVTHKIYLPENQIIINVIRRPTESSHQIHASLCVPLIQVHPKIDWLILSQLIIEHFWLTLLLLQGLTSPKPERGCVKTDCFDEALCREYEQHQVMTLSTINQFISLIYV